MDKCPFSERIQCIPKVPQRSMLSMLSMPEDPWLATKALLEACWTAAPEAQLPVAVQGLTADIQLPLCSQDWLGQELRKMDTRWHKMAQDDPSPWHPSPWHCFPTVRLAQVSDGPCMFLPFLDWIGQDTALKRTKKNSYQMLPDFRIFLESTSRRWDLGFVTGAASKSWRRHIEQSNTCCLSLTCML